MPIKRRDLAPWLLTTLAAAGLLQTIGCSEGVFSGEPKRFAGGGPIPDTPGDETTDEKSKTKKKKR